MFSGREGRLWRSGGACVPLAQALVCCLNLTWVAAERLERQRRVCARESVCVCVTGTELRQGRSESACSYSLAGSRSPLWTARVARDWRHAPKPVGWPRVTRESLTDDQTRAALARKVELNYMN